MLSSRRAFTLLELIVVIVVLGILAAIAVPTFRAVIERSSDAVAVAGAEAVGREAVALAGFEREDVLSSGEHLLAAVADAPGASFDPSSIDRDASTAVVSVPVSSGLQPVLLRFEGSQVFGSVLDEVPPPGPELLSPESASVTLSGSSAIVSWSAVPDVDSYRVVKNRFGETQDVPASSLEAVFVLASGESASFQVYSVRGAVQSFVPAQTGTVTAP